jgi:putative transposase
MKQILKTYKFRLSPNKKQEILINKTFGCTRYIYNQMLSERKNVYENLKDNKEELKK